jgi:hypothetical protein
VNISLDGFKKQNLSVLINDDSYSNFLVSSELSDLPFEMNQALGLTPVIDKGLCPSRDNSQLVVSSPTSFYITSLCSHRNTACGLV